VILGTEEAITSDLVNHGQTQFDPNMLQGDSIPLKEITRRAVQELERKIILQVLQANHWNRKSSARKLKISYRALLYKIRQAGLPSRNSRGLAEGDDLGSPARHD
jgi:DNA-binding NtrC family response regulator